MRGWIYWIIAAFFYGYEFLHRVAPSVLTAQIRLDFNINDKHLGLIAAMYFYAYAFFQIPAGILLDRYGAKKVLTAASITVGVGSFMFAHTESLYILYLSRLLIGTGSAFAFVGCIRIGTIWLDRSALPFIVGLTNLCGTLGAIIGGEPLALLEQSLGWRSSMSLISFVGLINALLILLIIPKHQEPKIPNKEQHWFEDIKVVVLNKQAWILGAYGAVIVAPIAALPELWGVEFLQYAYNLNNASASSITHTIFLGIAVGGPLIGWFANKSNMLIIMRTCSVSLLILLFLIIYLNSFNISMLYVLFFIYGVMSANMLLCFTLASEQLPLWSQGAAIGFINTLISIFSGIVQHHIGSILDMQRAEHAGSYLLSDFHTALVVLPICLMIGVILTLLIKPLQTIN